MLAISQDELGGPEVLKATTVPQPDPGVGRSWCECGPQASIPSTS